METPGDQTVRELVSELQRAWNEADSAGFARPFAEDADFVNIRGLHFRTREVIAKGHQEILDTIYKGSSVRYQVTQVRAIRPDVLLAHVQSALQAPAGPLAGEHNSTFSMVLVRDGESWRIASFQNTLVG